MLNHRFFAIYALSIAILGAGAAVFAADPAGGRGNPGQPPVGAVSEPEVVLPKSVSADGKPQINGPLVTGASVGRWFMFRIPVTGEAPLTFSADNLPSGLSLDANTGVITGAIPKATSTAVTLRVKNAKGETSRPLVIVAGQYKLALTPPLGWNSWNCYGRNVSDVRMRAAADGMEKSGLAAHGFQYVNLDDGWNFPGSGPNTRDADGVILPNEKFPDMKALGDYIHAKGLKFGIYSSPGPTTCERLAASYQHEEQDAKTWASWGVDYIKYDWCSYGNVPKPAGDEGAKLPYQVMRKALDKLDRDLVYSLCQYGNNNVWTWGDAEDIKGNLWRVTGDINTGAQAWQSMSSIGFQQSSHAQYAGPGHWNDTDMLVVGSVGLSSGGNPRPTSLTRNEQVTHIGLWVLLAAPLLLGCDMNQMDEFTVNLMCNDEALAVNQDPLGKQAWRIAALNADDTPVGAPNPAAAPAPAPGGRGRGPGNPQNSAVKQIWARPLIDGTYAVGLFNLGPEPATVRISLKDLGDGLNANIAGPVRVRDLWQLKDLAAATDTISAEVPRHGMVLLKVGTPKPLADVIADIVKMHEPK
jgi:alpha-galactosidase